MQTGPGEAAEHDPAPAPHDPSPGRASPPSGDASSRVVRWYSDTLPDVVPPELPVPASIGPYRILGRLGRGGMGEVFLAADALLHRRIALKRIRPDRSHAEELRRRFEIEARVTARLQHPAIIPVYHFDRGADIYYTMRPVEGMTLSAVISRLREGESGFRDQWPTARLVRLFLQVANAVAFAHSRGVIHRDLKPANVILGPFEEVLLLDWGLAKLREEAPASAAVPDHLGDLAHLSVETRGQGPIGTPAYMAPELFDGHAADELTDLYALGIMLFEILALQHPWAGPSRGEDRRLAPDLLAQVSRELFRSRLPARLLEAVAKAIAPDRRLRQPGVAAFAQDVAQALEGRAPWRPLGTEGLAQSWRFAEGRKRDEAGLTALSSRGDRRPFRFFCQRRLGRNVSLAFELSVRKGTHELAVWLNAPLGARGEIEGGYALGVLAGRRRILSLLRSGRDVAGGSAPVLEPRRWYQVLAQREGDRLSLRIDGDEVYAYTDVAPLGGGFVGLTGTSSGLQIRNLQVHERGTDVRVSCLAVPDTFFHRGLFEEAAAEYEAIALSHPDRVEAELARFRGGRCMLELYQRETDPDLRHLHLDRALEVFTERGRLQGTPLVELGRAMVAGELGRPDEKHEALSRALAAPATDLHRHVVIEWLLARLHAVGPDDRTTIAELLPLAIDHAMEHWGRRVVSDLVRNVRATWETPPFMSGRGRFREGELVSRYEARLFFAFWAARPSLVGDTFDRLRRLDDGLAPHHVTDCVFSLLALGAGNDALQLLASAEEALTTTSASDPSWRRALLTARIAALAHTGHLDESLERFSELELDPAHRAGNAARLALGKALAAGGRTGEAATVLAPLGARDYFAREHLAWLFLMDREPKRAHAQLAPLLDRKDHVLGRNLANVLLGAALLQEGEVAEARRTFDLLPRNPYPRSWTLGAYLGAGRLGDGSLDAYVALAFPWERRCLAEHRELLERSGWVGEP